ncbi:hypothetical protein B0H63DRAFT_542467 [Podospora didyma]|uniref:GPI anchored cell wall protein n=1 Tax=Podospora didyma TaxID=330526 RepID=A0AAE0NUK5_9PEZI|nr:hypothetical protein B0H63DRAFT_542467 [Podospora didyma]
MVPFIFTTLTLLAGAAQAAIITASGTTTVDLFFPGTRATPAPTADASVVNVDGTRTTYYVFCKGGSFSEQTRLANGDDACRFIGGQVTVDPSKRYEFALSQSTTRQVITATAGTGNGPLTGDTSYHFTTGSIGCDVISSGPLALCTGIVYNTDTARGSTSTGSVVISTTINIAQNMLNATITNGASKLATSTQSTRSSTGGGARMTQGAVLAGAAALMGGALMMHN